MIKTKIICTLGPASNSPQEIAELIDAGMNVARMNFSHASYEEHAQRLKNFREACEMRGKKLPVLMDMKGPEIRTGTFEQPVTLQAGAQYVIRAQDVPGDERQMSVNYKRLHEDIAKGQRLLIDDGLVELLVEKIEDGDIYATVQNGGVISSKKSVNVPGAKINVPALADKDRQDIAFAVENDFDFIAVSFCRSASDIRAVRRELTKLGDSTTMLIAKIENQQGVDNADEILHVANGLMVARGDLGVEIPVEKVPAVQKMLIKKTVAASLPVITATQMLDSMMRNPRPTRAEASDVANAIFDGTSCIMLSGETAAGKYPVEAVRTMVKIARTTEANINYWSRFTATRLGSPVLVSKAISHATCSTAMDLNAKAIVAVTSSGDTARSISRFRPPCPIVAPTTNHKVERQLHLSWGVVPCFSEFVRSTDELFASGAAKARETGAASDGDLLVITAGVPVGVSGSTNMVKVQMLGNVVISGQSAAPGVATGTVRLAATPEQATGSERNIILVLRSASDEFLPYLKHASALIVEDEDNDGRAATAGLTLGIPVLTGAHGAMATLKGGVCVTVDADKGFACYAE